MPKMIFVASCATCGADRKFMEFKAEPCGVHADTRDRMYGFRCLACKTIVPRLVDAEGREHAWEQGRHVEA